MLMLEKSVLDKLRDYAVTDEDKAAEQVSAAVKEMRDELNVDGTIDDYLKKRTAVDISEQALRRLLENKDAEWIEKSGIYDKLNAAGINFSGWRELVVTSGGNKEAATGSGGDVSLPALERVLNDLSLLLENVEHDNNSSVSSRISDSLDVISREINAGVAEANGRIDELAERFKSMDSHSRDIKHEWILMQDIVQELCQPLTVIHCTIDMLMEGKMSVMSDEGKSMLNLAHDASIRVRELAVKLIKVCGLPASLSPL